MNSTNPPEGTIRAALRHRDFRALLAGQAVSQFGDFLYNVALITLVYQRTGSAIWAGVTSAARVVPMLVAGPFGGIVADRFDRRRVLVTCDLARLLFMLALALVAAWHLPVVLAPVLAALATTAAAPSIPSVAGVTPRLVPDADLPGANAARSVFTAAAVILGPGLGGVLLFVSPALAFVINAATFAVSAACVLAVRAGDAFTVTRSAKGAAPGGLPMLGLLRDLADGAVALRRHPAAVRLLGADMACSFVLGMESVLFVLVARSAGLGLNGYAFMFAALGAGGMAGTTLAGRAARLPCRRVLIAALSTVGLSVAGVAILHWAAAILIVVAVGGAASLLVEITMNTGLQRMLPRDVFGRAYGLAVPVSIGVIGVGSLLAPVLDSTLGQTGALLACAAGVLAYTAFLALPTRHPAPAAQLRSPAGDHGPESALAALPVSRPADSAPVATSRRALCAAGHSMPIQPGSGLGATTPNLPPSHDQDRRQNNNEHVTEYLGMSGAAMLLLLHDFPDPGKSHRNPCPTPPSDTEFYQVRGLNPRSSEARDTSLILGDITPPSR